MAQSSTTPAGRQPATKRNQPDASTKLNAVQLHLLQMFSRKMGKSELADIKRLLSEYYVSKADEEMQRIQQEKPMSQADLDSLLHTHLRTPYKRK